MSSPQKILLIGLALAAIGVVLTWITAAIGSRPLAGAGAVALVILVLSHWHSFGQPYPLLAAVIAVGFILHWLSPGARQVIAIVLIAVFGVAPLVQVLSAHLFRQDRYTMVDLEARADATPTGTVEDVLVVIVDGYPSIEFARHRFGHQPTELVANLTANGFVVEEVAWSQFTRSALTVGSLMELQPVVEDDPPAPDGTLLPLYEIIRGDNLVAASLRSAGYEYHHIESGWDGGTCGPVDVCIPGPQIDETVWNLGVFSAARDWIARTHGNHFVAGSLNTVERLVELEEIFDDGQRDYVFAHLLLPHDPVVVDSDCNIRWPRESTKYDAAGDFEKFREQLACTDRLISEVAALAGQNTAVLITAD
ncbi:MAG TPA: hypothetical protein VMP13_08500, partial [Acidimicrobiia bacterium]|nr:hypothetical protein [Acidimicrobiia bacterium]